MYHWNDETIEYFISRNKPGCYGQYYREVEEFVKQNCTLEDGETYFDLRDDLINQVKNITMNFDNQYNHTKNILITEIWSYCKHTHNEQDLKDLQEFTVEELVDILNELK